MNAMLNINIRVAGAQAQAQLRALEQRINSLNAAGGRAGGNGLASMNNQLGRNMALQKFGKNLQWTGRQLEYNFTLPILLAGAASTKWALDNERASTQIRKVYGELGDDAGMLGKELDALSRSFELLSSRYGVVQSEVIEIGAAWAQAGAAGVAAAKATKLTLDAMILGEMDSIEATRGVIAVQSAYRLNTDQLREALGQLNAVENQTAINFKGLIEVITRAGGVSRTAGIDIRHLAAMAAVLVPATGTATQAGNALRTMISRLMAPTRESAELLGKMGINIMETSWQAQDGVGRIETMAAAFEKLTQSQKAVVSSAVASRWQINRFDILMEDVAKSLDDATKSQSAYNRGLEATSDQARVNAVYARELLTVLQSSPRAFSILTRTIQNSMAKAMLPLIPAIVGILAQVAKLTTWFSNLDPGVQKLAMAFLVLLAAVGPITRYWGSFILLGTTLVELFGWLTARLFGMSGAQIAAARTAGVHNFTLIQQHGLLGALIIRLGQFAKFLVALPFVLVGKTAYAMWWGIGKAGKAAAIAVGLAWRAMLTIVPYLLQASAALIMSVGGLVAGMWSAVTTTTANALGWFRAIHAAVAAGVSGIWASTAAFFKAVWLTAIVGVKTAWTALVGIAFAVGSAVTRAWWAAVAASQTVWVNFVWAVQTIMSKVPLIMAAAGRAAALAWHAAMTFAIFATQAFVIALTRLPAIVAAVGSAVATIWAALPAIFAAIGSAIAFAVANPLIALAIVAAVALAALAWHFRDKIGGAVEWVIKAFNRLPESIVQVMRSVINVVKKAALVVREWLSYLNPFARHSPSLVENVQRGIRTILDEYSRLNGVTVVIRRALTAMEQFKRATGGALADFKMGEMQEQKADIVAVAPGAGPAIDSLISSIFEMYGALELVNQQIQEQEMLVQAMANSLAAGMKPYNDAIFENEMAQKRLRLELLRMEQSGQSIDDIRDKMAALSGEIETLRGDQTELRLAGAGADVLSFYDEQINALEAQRTAMQQMQGPAQEMQDALEALRLEGEILQLERDIKFDPQIRALEEQEQKLRDLNAAYQDINSTISDMEGLLRSMSSAATSAASRAGAGGSHAEDMFDAAAGGDFEVPGGTSPPGLGREGGLADIEAFNAEMEAELQNALDSMGGIDMFGPFKDMWNSAWGWIKEQVGPTLEPIVGAIQEFFRGIDLGSIFGGGIDTGLISTGIESLKGVFTGFLEIASGVWQFLVETFGPVFRWIGEVVERAVTEIGGELKNWAPLFGEAMTAVSRLGSLIAWVFNKVIVPIIKVALGVILVAWKAVWPVLKHVLTPIVNAIIGIIRAGLEIIRGIITVVLGIINGEWGRVWDGILTIVDGVWDAIYSIISGVIGFIVGLVRGLVESVVGFFQWLYDVLVGNSIIPDMINAIVGWFQFLWQAVKAVWDLLWGAIKWAWENVGLPIFNAIKTVIDTVLIPAFNIAKSAIGTAFSAIGTGIKWVWDNVISPIFEALKKGIGIVGDTMTWVKDNIIAPVWNGISTIISNAWNGMKRILEGGINFFIDVFNALAGAINAVSDALGLGFRVPTKGRVSMSGGSSGGGVSGGGHQLYAKGGIPAIDFGGPGFRTRGAMAIVGEGNPSYPEYVIPTDPKYRGNALSLLSSLGAELFAKGGIPGSGVITGVVGGAAGAAKAFYDKIQWVRNKIGEMLGFMGDSMRKVVTKVVDLIGSKIVGALEGARDFAWDQGARLNPIDDVVNLFRARGGTIPNLGAGGMVLPRPGGTLVNVGERGQREAVVPLPSNFNDGGSNNFYGDLVFPNIKDGDDAEEFIRNLEGLVA